MWTLRQRPKTTQERTEMGRMPPKHPLLDGVYISSSTFICGIVLPKSGLLASIPIDLRSFTNLRFYSLCSNCRVSYSIPLYTAVCRILLVALGNRQQVICILLSDVSSDGPLSSHNSLLLATGNQQNSEFSFRCE